MNKIGGKNMALQKEFIKNIFGRSLVFPEAYFQITYLSGSKNNFDIQVTVYDSIQKMYVVDQKSYSYIPNIKDTNTNSFKEGYDYLKSLPALEDALDLIEDEQEVR